VFTKTDTDDELRKNLSPTMRQLILETYDYSYAPKDSYPMFTYMTGRIARTLEALQARGVFDHSPHPKLTDKGVRLAEQLYEKCLAEDAKTALADAVKIGLRPGMLVMRSSLGVGSLGILESLERVDPVGLRSFGGSMTRASVREGVRPTDRVVGASLAEVRPFPFLRASTGANAREIAIVQGGRGGSLVAWETSISALETRREEVVLRGSASALRYRAKVAKRLKSERWTLVRATLSVAEMSFQGKRVNLSISAVEEGSAVVTQPSQAGWGGAASYRVFSSDVDAQEHAVSVMEEHVGRGWEVSLASV